MLRRGVSFGTKVSLRVCFFSIAPADEINRKRIFERRCDERYKRDIRIKVDYVG